MHSTDVVQRLSEAIAGVAVFSRTIGSCGLDQSACFSVAGDFKYGAHRHPSSRWKMAERRGALGTRAQGRGCGREERIWDSTDVT
jgi:hypothetical protein